MVFTNPMQQWYILTFQQSFFFQYLVFYFGTDHELQKNGVFFITGIYDKKTHILKSMNR